MLLRDDLGEIRRCHVQDAQMVPEEAMTTAPALDACRMRRGTNIRAWLTVFPSTVNGTDTNNQEWRDDLFINYGIDPTDLPSHCDSCNTKNYICHFLVFKKDGLITTTNNKLCDGVADLAGKYFTPSHMRNNTRTHQDSVVRDIKDQPTDTLPTIHQQLHITWSIRKGIPSRI